MEKKRVSAIKVIGRIFAFLFVALCFVVIFFNLTHEYHRVVGDSMYPNLNNGRIDSVFVSKIKSYSYGDVIVTKKGEPDENGKDGLVVKRVIAMGGDRVSVKEYNGDYRIFIIYSNQTEEQVLDEPYLKNYNVNIKLFSKFNEMIVKYGKSTDTDNFLTIGKDEIFFLGDNRDDSRDCSNYGPKPKSLVVGKVDYVAYGSKIPYIQVAKQFFGW